MTEQGKPTQEYSRPYNTRALRYGKDSNRIAEPSTGGVTQSADTGRRTVRKRLAAGAFLIVAGPVALGSVAYADREKPSKATPSDARRATPEGNQPKR